MSDEMEGLLNDYIDRLPWQSMPWFAWSVLFGLIAVCLAVLA